VNRTLATTAGFEDDLTSGFVRSNQKGRTIVRMIIDLTYVLVSAGSGGILTLGVTSVLASAFAALASPDPSDPSTQPGWMVRQQDIVASTNAADRSQFTNIHLDIRFKRVLRGEDDRLLFIVQAGALSASVNIDGMIRTLWQKT